MDTVVVFSSTIIAFIWILATEVKQIRLLITEITKLVNALIELKATIKKFMAKK